MRSSETELEYTEGYVAFIDILGFKQFVSNPDNISKTKDIFDFVSKLQYFFNTTSKLKTKVAFFSDSIVLTTDEFDTQYLLIALWLAEDYLHKKTGLIFRGALTKGLYYHEDIIAFGPAIVESFFQEKEAKYSRIVIDNSIIKSLNHIPVEIMKDIDGKYCLNPVVASFYRFTNPATYKITKEAIFKSLEYEKNMIIEDIKDNYYQDYSDKYIWRLRPYNIICDNISKYIKAYGLEFSADEIDRVKQSRIALKDSELAKKEL